MYALHETRDPIELRNVHTLKSNDECGHADCGKAACTSDFCPVIHEAGKSKTFAKGDVLFWDGDESDYLYLVVSGIVRGSKLLGDGRRQVARFAFPGDILEYRRQWNYPYTAEAITPVTAIAISRQRFEQLMSRVPCLRGLVMQVILDELEGTREQLLALGRLSATERVAYFLSSTARHLGRDSEGAFDLPMSRQDIADYLGLTIETVSRIISKLKRAGKIRLLPSGRIIIPDLEEFSDDLLADVA